MYTRTAFFHTTTGPPIPLQVTARSTETARRGETANQQLTEATLGQMFAAASCVYLGLQPLENIENSPKSGGTLQGYDVIMKDVLLLSIMQDTHRDSHSQLCRRQIPIDLLYPQNGILSQFLAPSSENGPTNLVRYLSPQGPKIFVFQPPRFSKVSSLAMFGSFYQNPGGLEKPIVPEGSLRS